MHYLTMTTKGEQRLSCCSNKKLRTNYVFKLTIVKPYWKWFFCLTTFLVEKRVHTEVVMRRYIAALKTPVLFLQNVYGRVYFWSRQSCKYLNFFERLSNF